MGVSLRQTLAQGAVVTRLAWSPDGTRLAAGCGDNVVRVFHLESGAATELRGHTEIVSCVSWNADGARLASGSADRTVRVWDVASATATVALPHSAFVRTVAWTDADTIASGDEDDLLYFWHAARSELLRKQELHGGWVLSTATSPGGEWLAVGSGGGKIWLLALRAAQRSARMTGHKSWVDALAWSPDGRRLASGSGDTTVRIWDVATRKQIGILEAHTAQVRSVTFSADGRLLASKADDGTVRLWDAQTWQGVGQFDEDPGDRYWPPAIAFHPRHPVLATLGDAIRIWDVDTAALLGEPATDSVRYTAAKIALVGDSGVGKTTLGWRLAHDEFRSHPATHGQQFWVVENLGMTRADGTECEAVVWDFAGQPDYRIVHALFIDDLDLALVLFDPTRGLEGARYWLKQLPRERTRALLVASRSDAGTSTLTENELRAFCARENVQGFVSTSALTGSGVSELRELIRETMPWESMPATVTTATFRRIKDHVLRVKETRGASVVLELAELARQLSHDDPQWRFSASELVTALTHLATHGYVALLRDSAGKERILLVPELLASVASSLVLEARANEKGLGAIDEQRTLRGELRTPGIEGLPDEQRALLLDASIALLLRHNVCFRQTLGGGTMLVFPALINQKRPQLENHDVVEFMAYRIRGAVENVYASLVVLLGYSPTFSRTNQWQNQAEYETAGGGVCGFRLTAEAEGEIEISLYYSRDKTADHPLFQALVEMFLGGRDLRIEKIPLRGCTRCEYRPARAEIMQRVAAGKQGMRCSECGEHIDLTADGADPLPQRTRGERKAIGDRKAFEMALSRVQAEVARRDRKPVCFISYAWGDEDEKKWVWELMLDLQNAGVEVILDQKDAPPATSLPRFISDGIGRADCIVVVGTPRFRSKYDQNDTIVVHEAELIHWRLMQPQPERPKVIPLLLASELPQALPLFLQIAVHIDFRDPARYFESALHLIARIHDLDRASSTLAGDAFVS